MELKILTKDYFKLDVDGDIQRNIKNSLKKKSIELIYKMVYPYRNWNDNYLNACYDLRKEIITWCNNHDMKIPVLMIGRLLNLTFVHHDTLSSICTKVLDNLTDLCLEINEEPFKSALVVSFSTNTYPHLHVSDLCKSIRTKLYKHFFVCVELFDLKVTYILYIDGLLMNFFDLDDYTVDYTISNSISSKTIDEFRKLINFKITVEDFDRSPNNFNLTFFDTYQERKFIIYVHDLFRSGKIPFDILWDDLCTLPIIQEFRV